MKSLNKNLQDLHIKDSILYPLSEITSAINIGVNPRKFFKLNPDNAEGFYVTVRELNGLKGVIRHQRTDAIDKVAVEFINKRACIDKGDILFSNTGTVGKLALVKEKPGDWSVNEGIYVVKPKNDYVDSRYLYYYLDSTHAKKDYSKKLTGSTLKHVTQKALSELMVPVPPLEVQAEIVRILDNFTELTAELTTELTARKQQFFYYSREIISSFSKDAITVPLSEVGKWQGGKTPSMQEKAYWDQGKIPWISSKDMKMPVLSDTQDHITEKAITRASMTLFPAGSVAIVTRSGILKHTFPVSFVPFETTINQDIKALTTFDNISARYIAYVLQAYGEDIRIKTKKLGGTVDSLDFQKVLDYRIPLPNYEAQLMIVDILNKFETMCSNLSEGLPAEIEVRQKQYEYYRDKLLTFPELKQ